MLQVWGVIIGIGNQSFAEHWALVGAGTRSWEVSLIYHNISQQDSAESAKLLNAYERLQLVQAGLILIPAASVHRLF